MSHNCAKTRTPSPQSNPRLVPNLTVVIHHTGKQPWLASTRFVFLDPAWLPWRTVNGLWPHGCVCVISLLTACGCVVCVCVCVACLLLKIILRDNHALYSEHGRFVVAIACFFSVFICPRQECCSVIHGVDCTLVPLCWPRVAQLFLYLKGQWLCYATSREWEDKGAG